MNNYKEKYNPEFKVRRSQLLTPFGIGALMDINNQSLMVADSEYWGDDLELVHDIRLEKILGCKGFIEPPLSSMTNIQGKRFPRWYFSPVDRRLKTIDKWREEIKAMGDNKSLISFDKKPFTKKDNNRVELVPVRIICACEHGHSQDFPWLEWAHMDSSLSAADFKNHKLVLKSDAKSASISELKVCCTTCESKNNVKLEKSLAGIFDDKKMAKRFEKINVHCEGKHYWKHTICNEKCDQNLKVMLRNANNFYFPSIMSSVNIPFNENTDLEKIMSHKEYSSIIGHMKKSVRGQEYDFFENNSRVSNSIDYISEDLDLSNGYVRESVGTQLGYYSSEKTDLVTVMDYRRAEFQVLTGRESFNHNSNIEFKIKVYNKPDFSDSVKKSFFSKLTLVHSLEVMSALTGFSRIDTLNSDKILEDIEEEETNTKNIKMVSLKRKDDTFVGIKARGEGIFFELSNKKVKEWLKVNELTPMFRKINEKLKFDIHEDEKPYIAPDYYLVHTLSHLLIRELSLTCGYTSSSLKERIYYSNEDGEEMYGVLIYTSSSDSEGTLGGLVKQGLPKKFFATIDAAIEKAKWCSFDPVCIESVGQGRNSLNAGACHACSLISETSCEKMNVFLDRSMLIGTLDNPEWGFFGEVVNLKK
ncbi:DUF1998 domain-containing protein [Vagococcus sp. BWB3-3]|uniref:DUF1998 domain-containing protein n=1 Tax=Vagococcus allomyrinae TaxID=2794353 RepID=A0A940SWQ0_9ENTE|nr:DUF1998 domain-containing protein [Vagococcus allomyrinae]MBP1042386.1 DUF1998 domain-containing protein [Vagococcus allomyrinae]